MSYSNQDYKPSGEYYYRSDAEPVITSPPEAIHASASSFVSVQPTIVQIPMHDQHTGYEMQPNPGNSAPIRRRVRPPIGRWADNICDW